MYQFEDTRWSLVQRATHDKVALEVLCVTYRPAVAAWFVRQKLGRESAEDYTQAFFAHILEKNTIEFADPAKGRFRTFLLTSIKNFYLNEIAKSSALKRGGGHGHVPFDDQVVGSDSPEAAFNRDFVAILLAKALRRLHDESISSGKGDLFQHLQPFLAESPGPDDYQELASSLGMRRNTIAVAVHRLRARMREITLDELRDTVASEADFEEELATLKHTLR